MLVDKRNADRRRDWKTAWHTLWFQAYIVSGSAQPCPLADCGEGRKRGKIEEKKRETVKKAIENQLTVGFLSLFLLYLHRYEECIDTITKYSCDISVHCVSLSKGED